MLNSQQLSDFAQHFAAICNDAALADHFRANASAAKLPRGQTICNEGDNCSRLALVTDGSARVYKLAESGREITLYRVEPGECCILTASCMLSERTFPANAIVELDLAAIVVPAPKVVAWMTESVAWRQFLWSLLAARLGDVIGLVEEVAFRRMDERLIDYLHDKYAVRGPVLRATHHQIAADLGTSREVVSRLLKDLEQRGLVQLGRGRIQIVDADALVC